MAFEVIVVGRSILRGLVTSTCRFPGGFHFQLSSAPRSLFYDSDSETERILGFTREES